MRRVVRWSATLLCATMVGGAGQRDPGTFAAREPQIVRLTVLNNRFEDATIHALWKGGAKRRVGVVTGMTSQTFTFEWVSEVVRFEVDFVAADDYTVEPIDVAAGDHLDLVILNTKG